MELAQHIPTMLMAAWLLPLVSFALIVFFGKHMGKAGVKAGYVATGAIGGAFVLSMMSLVAWLSSDTAEPSHVAASRTDRPSSDSSRVAG